jgi:hypothetical protein
LRFAIRPNSSRENSPVAAGSPFTGRARQPQDKIPT